MQEVQSHADNVQEAPVHDASPSAAASAQRKALEGAFKRYREREDRIRLPPRRLCRPTEPVQVKSRTKKTRKGGPGPEDGSGEPTDPGGKGNARVEPNYVTGLSLRKKSRRRPCDSKT